MGHGDTEGKDLLELELDGGADGVDLVVGVIGVLEEGWELTELVHGRSEETWNLLHDGGGGKEEVVLAGKLLDLLLVLVESLKTLDIHAWDASGLGLLDVLGITKDATGHAWTRKVRELDGTSETLVLLGVVVLENDLELDGLFELALLVSGTLEDFGDALLESFGIDFTTRERARVRRRSLPMRVRTSSQRLRVWIGYGRVKSRTNEPHIESGIER